MKAQKPCPVERGSLLIRLEHCRDPQNDCGNCPGQANADCLIQLTEDALAYIGWLEEENQRMKQELERVAKLAMLREACGSAADCESCRIGKHYPALCRGEIDEETIDGAFALLMGEEKEVETDGESMH